MGNGMLSGMTQKKASLETGYHHETFVKMGGW